MDVVPLPKVYRARVSNVCASQADSGLVTWVRTLPFSISGEFSSFQGPCPLFEGLSVLGEAQRVASLHAN